MPERVSLSLLLLALLPARAFCEPPRTSTVLPLRAPKEVYVYSGTIVDGSRKGETDGMTMSFEKQGTNVICRSTVDHDDAKEMVEVTVTSNGRLISAHRSFSSRTLKQEGRIEVSGKTVSFSRKEDGKTQEKKKSRDTDLCLVADVSLMASLRTHPFGKGQISKLQLAGFSQMLIDVTIEDTGEETLRTPAGTFDCYQVETTFSVFFIKKRMSYWVTKAPPHFMVRHYGVRGRGTPTYDSKLEKILPPLPADYFHKKAAK